MIEKLFQKVMLLFCPGKTPAHEADEKMTVEYSASTVTNMDIENSNIGYKQLFADGSKIRYSGNKMRTSFQIAFGDVTMYTMRQ